MRVLFCIFILLSPFAMAEGRVSSAIVAQQFIFDKAPFRSCHASTIVQTRSGFLAAWFGGSGEGASDVQIWTSHFIDGVWSKPMSVASGMDADGSPLPTWNPVLFQSSDGRLLLYYKVGRDPASWWGMEMSSLDGGRTWSRPVRLQNGILGPIKNKPVQLTNGTILSPSSTEDDGWRVHIEISEDFAKSWRKSDSLNSRELFVIQPTLLRYADDAIQMLARHRQRDSSSEQRIMQSWSYDFGKTWTRFSSTELADPNSGVDSVVLKDGRAIVAYNDSFRSRSSLSLAVSTDQGKSWAKAVEVENQPGAEFSYPAIIEGLDGMLHLTYTWKRTHIKHVTIDPSQIL